MRDWRRPDSAWSSAGELRDSSSLKSLLHMPGRDEDRHGALYDVQCGRAQLLGSRLQEAAIAQVHQAPTAQLPHGPCSCRHADLQQHTQLYRGRWARTTGATWDVCSMQVVCACRLHSLIWQSMLSTIDVCII